MRKSDIYSGGWLKAPDMLAKGQQNGMNLTIKGINTAQNDDGKDQRAISFQETDQQLGLNVTNWDSIAEITGKDDDDHWIGAVINVYPHKLDRPFNGKTHGLRVRKPSAINGNPATADVRKAAYDVLVASMPPDTTREELGRKWVDAVKAMFPGKSQATMTVAEWTQLKDSFMEYGGEPGDTGPAADDSIPF